MADTYWQHEKSGDIYAVRTGPDGAAIGVTGPITQAEATTENVGNFDYDAEDVDWANEQTMRVYELDR
jgi:hypothetical protein